MSFLTASNQSNEELTYYLTVYLSEDEVKLLQKDEGIISFWVDKRESFPILHRCALQIFVTPASSTQIERNIIMLKLINTRGRNRMKDDIMNATARVRYALSA